MFINTPNNFTSVWGELNFEYKVTDKSDLLMTITNTASNKEIGVKKFYSTTEAQINVAPLIIDLMMPKVVKYSHTSFTVPDSGFPQISVSVDSTESEPRTFSYSRTALKTPSVATTMPSERIMNRDEWDQAAVVVVPGSELRYALSGREIGQSSYRLITTSEAICSNGVRIMRLIADEYADDYDSLKVDFLANDTLIDTIRYTLNDQSGVGYRIAWISSKGSIEYYTFPAVSDEVHLNSGRTVKTLRSAYGTQREIEALSEIISSPKVWKIAGEEIEEIEVMTTEQVIRKDGALWIVNIKVAENG